MHSVTLRSHVGSDGILNLQVPSGVRDAELEATVTVKALFLTSQANQPEQRGWQPGFFELAGSWEGEPLVRPRQPLTKKPEKLGNRK
jgi:hypothetical protein